MRDIQPILSLIQSAFLIAASAMLWVAADNAVDTRSKLQSCQSLLAAELEPQPGDTK